MAWTNKIRDNQSIYNAASNTRLTVPIAGIYLIELSIAWQSNATGAGYRHLQLLMNGATTIREMISSSPAATKTTTAFVVTNQMVTGDYIEAKVRQTSGANLDVLNDASTIFGITWLGNG